MAKKSSQQKIDTLMNRMKPSHIRFVYLILGDEDGKCFNNATLSYIRAFNIDTPLTKVRLPDGTEGYSSEYKSAKSSAYELLTKPDIIALRHEILLELGFKPETIKKRFAELAYQNKNLPLAHASLRDMAKMAKMLDEDPKRVDIPQLDELSKSIKDILTPKKK